MDSNGSENNTLSAHILDLAYQATPRLPEPRDAYKILEERICTFIKQYFENTKIASTFIESNRVELNLIINQSLQNLTHNDDYKFTLTRAIPTYLKVSEGLGLDWLEEVNRRINIIISRELVSIINHSPSYLPIVVHKELKNLAGTLQKKATIEELSSSIKLSESKKSFMMEYAGFFGIPYSEIMTSVFEEDVNKIQEERVKAVISLLTSKNYSEIVKMEILSQTQADNWGRELDSITIAKIEDKIDRVKTIRNFSEFITESIYLTWKEAEFKTFEENIIIKSKTEIQISLKNGMSNQIFHQTILDHLKGRQLNIANWNGQFELDKETLVYAIKTLESPDINEEFVVNFIKYSEDKFIEISAKLFEQIDKDIISLERHIITQLMQNTSYFMNSEIVKSWAGQWRNNYK